MSVPRILVAAGDLGRESITLGGAPHRHLARVLRARAGDRVVLFDGEGGEAEARVTAVDRRAATLSVGKRRTIPPPLVRITLLQAVVKGERMALVVQKATELGVAAVVPVLTARSVPRPAGSSVERVRRWQAIAREAARQCGRADVPRIESPMGLDAALAACAQPMRVALWEGSRGRPLRAALPSSPGDVALLVGPEGGFTDGEIAAVRAAGFEVAGLGPRILRAETAAVVAVALVQSAAGGLD